MILFVHFASCLSLILVDFKLCSLKCLPFSIYIYIIEMFCLNRAICKKCTNQDVLTLSPLLGCLLLKWWQTSYLYQEHMPRKSIQIFIHHQTLVKFGEIVLSLGVKLLGFVSDARKLCIWAGSMLFKNIKVEVESNWLRVSILFETSITPRSSSMMKDLFDTIVYCMVFFTEHIFHYLYSRTCLLEPLKEEA